MKIVHIIFGCAIGLLLFGFLTHYKNPTTCFDCKKTANQQCAGMDVKSVPQAATIVSGLDARTVQEIGTQAYIYGYPLVLMDLTQRVMTSVSVPQGDARAPINQFGHAAGIPTPQMTDVVRPNVDTLYSSAWLDLAKEPIILSVPDTYGRSYVMPFYDMYTNVFFIVGQSTTGTEAGKFIVTGPEWKGIIPEGMTQIKSPSNYAWIVGRTQINGAADLPKVRAIQKKYTLTPLGQQASDSFVALYGHHIAKQKPMDQLAALSAQEFFTMMMKLMAQNPPASADKEFLEKMASIGLVPSRNFDFKTLSPEVKLQLAMVPKVALNDIINHSASLGKIVNGWNVITANIGTYGTHYLDRATIALIGLGALPATISLYPTTGVDNGGHKLSGKHRYIIHFDKGQTPPAAAFWSLTMYDSQGFLVKNLLNRYGLGDRDPLKFNKDGSLDLYVQHWNPGARKKSNWLPAPADDFSLTLRLYMPQESALNGTWLPPKVTRIK